ncbi:MAG TPA: Rpn family recombination-promoting nuclease/putative transposase [Spirochaetia bacterium]
MKLGIKLTVDVVFKTVFADEAHTRLTTCLVNSVLEQAGRPRAARLTLLNPYRLGQFHDDKDVILDVRAVDEAEREFQIELQIETYETLPRRMLHNWAACYLGRLKKGQDFKVLRPVVSIWILEHPLFRDGSWFHILSLRDEETDRVASDDILILVVELPAWIAARGEHLRETVAHSLDRWLYLLWKAEEIDPAEPPSEVAGGEYREALEIMAAYTKSEMAREIYLRRLDLQRERATIKAEAAEAVEAAKAAAREAGLAEGIGKSARETAKALKELGVNSDVIAKATKLSRAEVEGL